MSAAKFKNGAPFNLQTIRWHAARGGWEWQYWNHRINRWKRYTRKSLPSAEARQEIARYVYGVDPDRVAVETGSEERA